MTDEEANDIVSVRSSPSESSTLPSTVLQEEADSPMGDKDAEANPSDEAGDCLGNRPASSNTRPVSNDMLEENEENSSAMPQGVDPQDDSSGNRQVRPPSCQAAFRNMGNSRSRLRTSRKSPQSAGTQPRHPSIQKRHRNAPMP